MRVKRWRVVVDEEVPVVFAALGLVAVAAAALIYASRDREVFLLCGVQSASTWFSVCYSGAAAPFSRRIQTTQYYRKMGSAIGHSETMTELLQGECN